MRRQMKAAGKLVLSGLALAIAFGCSHRAPVSQQSVTASIDEQVQKVQARTDLSDEQKSHIIAMLKTAAAVPTTAKAN